MPEYLLSLEERRKKLIEDCCGGSGGDMSDSMPDGEPPTADSEGAPSLIDRTIKNLKSKRKKR